MCNGLPGSRCVRCRNAKAPTRCWISRRDLCRTLVSRVAVLYACTEDRRRYRGWLLDHRWGECLDTFDPSDALAGPMVEGAAIEPTGSGLAHHRMAERRVGKEGVTTCRDGGGQYQ